MMSRLQKGFIAGFTATAVVSAVDVVAGMIQQGVGERWFYSFPTLAATMVGRMLGDAPGEGLNQIWVGWVAHFIIGTLVLGGIFAVLAPKLPTDTPATKGMVFAVGAWLVLCLTVMPMAGLGLFGAEAGFGTIGWMLVTHLLFGIVMGRMFFRLHGDVGHAHRVRPVAV